MNEIVTVITNLISNLGFPIACVCVMFYMLNKEREDHKAETAELTKAIQNNTSMMEKVLDRIETLVGG